MIQVYLGFWAGCPNKSNVFLLKPCQTQPFTCSGRYTKTSESGQFTHNRNRLLRVLDVWKSQMKLSTDSVCGEDLFSWMMPSICCPTAERARASSEDTNSVNKRAVTITSPPPVGAAFLTAVTKYMTKATWGRGREGLCWLTVWGHSLSKQGRRMAAMV